MRATFKRTRLWIDPPFQLRLLLYTGTYFLLYTVFVWHIGFFFETLRTFIGQGSMKGLGTAYAEYFHKQLPLLITFAVTTPLFLYDLLKLSHRVAGPLYRCRRVMLEMAAGKSVPEFKPRKHDLMRDLFAAFNKLIVVWNARAGASANGHAVPAHVPAETAEGTSPALAATAADQAQPLKT
jgi:hypothetical protein